MTHIPHQITHYMQKENLFTKSGIPSKKAKVNYFTGKIAAKDISAKIKPSTEKICLLYTSPSPRDTERSRMPSSA